MGFADNLLQTESRRVVSMNSSDSSKERSGRQPMENHRASPPKHRGVWAIREYPPGCGPRAPPIVGPNEEAIRASTEKFVPRKYPPRKSVSAVRDFPPSCGRNALRICKEMNEVLGFDGSKNIGQEMSDAEPLKEMVMTVGKEITDSDLDGDAYGSTLQRDVPRPKGGEVQQEPKGSSTKGDQDEFGDGSENAVKVVQEGRPERSFEFLVGNAQDQKFDAVPKSAIGASEKDPVKKIAACIENGSHKRKVPDVSGCEKESLEVEIAPGRIVNGLMAKKNCPWRQVKANNKLDNLAGSMSEKKWKKDDFILVPRSDSQLEKNEEENHGVSHIKKNSFRTQGAYLGVDHIVESDTEDHLDQGEERDDFRLVKRQHNVDVSLPPSCPSSSGGKVVENDATVSRRKVRETMRLFQSVFRKILQKEEAKVKEPGVCKRIDFLAAKDLKERGKYINVGKQIIGSVPGVEVGDEFQYRVELTVIGLHRQTQGGIDYIKQGSKILATSIVSSGGYDDDTDNSDVLIYTGSGGNMMNADKEPEDQKLERGNLALKNSADAKNPVRVIRGDTKVSDSSDAKARTYVYDGLYLVDRYWQETGSRGKLVFKFMLVRMQGQPELAWKVVKKSKVREGLCMDDISKGKEKMPICAVNTIDDERPPTFTYATHMIYSDQCRPGPPKGCSCTKECSEAAAKCLCIKKNGGEIPYNHNGALVEVKDLVYECGPSCGCPPSCYNRVSQFGIKFQLEIFKTESTGWGVRSLNSIPSGSFICEYVGELLDEKEANLRTGNDEYLFDIGDKDSDGLHATIPWDSSSFSEAVGDVSFTIDAKQYGNVGRFVNHSCSPNLYAQDVLFDHDDKRIPHVMLFARENIPPLQELTYYYNYKIDTVYDSDGSIKKKNCYCGSQECSGRMY